MHSYIWITLNRIGEILCVRKYSLAIYPYILAGNIQTQCGHSGTCSSNYLAEEHTKNISSSILKRLARSLTASRKSCWSSIFLSFWRERSHIFYKCTCMCGRDRIFCMTSFINFEMKTGEFFAGYRLYIFHTKLHVLTPFLNFDAGEIFKLL